VGLRSHHANRPILIEGDPLPVRLRRSQAIKARKMTRPAADRSGIAVPRSARQAAGSAAPPAATVAALAGIAGAISHSHMRQLAQDHGQLGWHAHKFPLSVHGLEIVASLVLLAARRTAGQAGCHGLRWPPAPPAASPPTSPQQGQTS
jgi:hypothetical protein